MAVTGESSGLARKWGQIAETATAVGLAALEGLDPGALDAKAIKDVLTGGAIATDKQNLLTGQPTSRDVQIRVAYIGLDDLPRRARALLSGTDSGTELGSGAVIEGEAVEISDTRK